jgi:ABC-type lipoprotein export system ATPase subunit
MPSQFQFNIPTGNAVSTNFILKLGEILYVLGANGSGKSSLVSRLFNENQMHARRISAHRQTWFESNALDMTPRSREDLENNLKNFDRQARSRYWEWNSAGRSGMAIFDLIDADAMQERKIAGLLRTGDVSGAQKEARNPSPIQVINELMRLSNLPIEINLEQGQKITARKGGGNSYSVAELSDGERNAFLIAANVLTVKAGTLILIDEPERHLHRSIISPLLRLLFDKRKDCAFVVSTHDLVLPVDAPEASTMLVRGCEYQGQDVRAWTVDVVPPGVGIEEELKRDLLGARRKMLFVEGTEQSLDKPLYSLLFPDVSVIPKESCREVEQAVRGLRSARDMHWIAAWGLVDNDQRSVSDISRLKSAGIWALKHYSVESLYYHPKIIARLAERQARVTGDDAVLLITTALEGAVAAARNQREHLVTSAVLRSARDRIRSNLPLREDIQDGGVVKVEVNVSELRVQEEARFEELASSANWDGLLARYPLRESPALDRIVSGLKFANRSTYRTAVLKLLQDEQSAIDDLRGLLQDLYEKVSA